MAADCAKTTIFAKQINTLPKRITIHNDRLQTVQKVTAIATILGEGMGFLACPCWLDVHE